MACSASTAIPERGVATATSTSFAWLYAIRKLLSELEIICSTLISPQAGLCSRQPQVAVEPCTRSGHTPALGCNRSADSSRGPVLRQERGVLVFSPGYSTPRGALAIPLFALPTTILRSSLGSVVACDFFSSPLLSNTTPMKCVSRSTLWH